MEGAGEREDGGGQGKGRAVRSGCSCMGGGT